MVDEFERVELKPIKFWRGVLLVFNSVAGKKARSKFTVPFFNIMDSIGYPMNILG